jgi:hypothetical protein
VSTFITALENENVLALLLTENAIFTNIAKAVFFNFILSRFG